MNPNKKDKEKEVNKEEVVVLEDAAMWFGLLTGIAGASTVSGAFMRNWPYMLPGPFRLAPAFMIGNIVMQLL